MTATPLRLSLADQVLANSVAYLCCQRIEDDKTVMVLEAIAKVLPHVTRQISQVDALAKAAFEVLSFAPRRYKASHAADWAAAMMRASYAAENFLFWRGAMAMDAFTAQTANQPKEGEA